MKARLVSYNQLADFLAQNEFLFKFAHVCDIFAKLNKLHISRKGPDKNVLDLSDKIAAFIKKLSLRNYISATLSRTLLSSLLSWEFIKLWMDSPTFRPSFHAHWSSLNNKKKLYWLPVIIPWKEGFTSGSLTNFF